MTMPFDPARRAALTWGLSGLAAAALPGCRWLSRSTPRIVIVGGGFAGTTVARYLARWCPSPIDITLIADRPTHFLCPGSNPVIGAMGPTWRFGKYDGLIRQGVRLVVDRVTAIDRDKRRIITQKKRRLDYDWLILSPGVAFQPEPQFAKGSTIAAWGSEPEAKALSRQIDALTDGDRVVISVPLAPFKCPAAPYERACLIARHIQRSHIKAKVIVLDENAEIVSKATLFHSVFKDRYSDIVDYRPETPIVSIDPTTRRVETAFDDIEATLINRIPAQQAPQLLVEAGLIPKDRLWCPIDWQTMKSLGDEQVFVIGDAAESAAQLPKSAHVANNQAKVAAAALIREIIDAPPFVEPVVMNCCFSFVDESEAIHLASMSRYDYESHAMLPIEASISQSPAPSELEGVYAKAWLTNIIADSFG